MADIALPSQDFDKLTVELDQNVQVNRSAWTGHRRITGMPGVQKWYASATLPVLATEAEERPWRAFFARAKGPVNTFDIQVACNQRTGSDPTFEAQLATNSIRLAGLPANTTQLIAGQYITVALTSGHFRLALLTSDLIVNSSGKAVASFEPDLAGTPIPNALVFTINPITRTSLINTRQGWTRDGAETTIVIDAEEAL
jgi:hypothetical protein